MSEAVNLKRARIIEAGTPEQNGILIRVKRGDPFTRIGGVEDGEVEVDETHRKFYEDELQTRQMTVLAEFPVTLADLIPEGCEAFRFKRVYEVELTATKGTGTEADIWVIGGMQGHWRDLNKLSADLGVDLDTVVPLRITVHPQYVEERR